MTPEQFKLLGTLPGLYYARDQIQNQIDMIESSILGNSKPKKLGRPPKISSEDPIKNVEEERYDSIGRKIGQRGKSSPKNSKAMSEKMKEVWANMSPEDRAKRREKMNKALRKSWKIRKQNAMGAKG